MATIRITLSALLILVVITGCRVPEQRESSPEEVIRIRVVKVENIEYSIPVRATGVLGTMKEIKLSFKTGGIIKKITVREGEQVERGQELAELDLSEISAQVEQARIGYEKAGRDLLRAENLYHDSVVTLEQLQNARSAYQLAKTQKQIAEFNLSHSRINAPADGKIQKILVEGNEMIAPGYPAILFASTENDWVLRVSLVDKDIVKLALGDSARVQMDAFPGKIFRAEVAELGTFADPLTGTYEAELLILQAMPQFRTGFIARAEIFPEEKIHSLVVPFGAVLDANDRTGYVFVYDNDRLEKRRIRIGAVIDSFMVVEDGLLLGEEVVTDGVAYLREDANVSLVKEPETETP